MDFRSIFRSAAFAALASVPLAGQAKAAPGDTDYVYYDIFNQIAQQITGMAVSAPPSSGLKFVCDASTGKLYAATEVSHGPTPLAGLLLGTIPDAKMLDVTGFFRRGGTIPDSERAFFEARLHFKGLSKKERAAAEKYCLPGLVI